MDDGLGFSIGALFGGFLYQEIGGKQSFRIFALIALITCIAHIILRPASTHEIRMSQSPINEVIETKINETKSHDKTFEEVKLTDTKEFDI